MYLRQAVKDTKLITKGQFYKLLDAFGQPLRAEYYPREQALVFILFTTNDKASPERASQVARELRGVGLELSLEGCVRYENSEEVNLKVRNVSPEAALALNDIYRGMMDAELMREKTRLRYTKAVFDCSFYGPEDKGEVRMITKDYALLHPDIISRIEEEFSIKRPVGFFHHTDILNISLERFLEMLREHKKYQLYTAQNFSLETGNFRSENFAYLGYSDLHGVLQVKLRQEKISDTLRDKLLENGFVFTITQRAVQQLVLANIRNGRETLEPEGVGPRCDISPRADPFFEQTGSIPWGLVTEKEMPAVAGTSPEHLAEIYKKLKEILR